MLMQLLALCQAHHGTTINATSWSFRIRPSMLPASGRSAWAVHATPKIVPRMIVLFPLKHKRECPSLAKYVIKISNCMFSP